MKDITFVIPNRGGEHIEEVIKNFRFTFEKYFDSINFIVIEQCDNKIFMKGQLYNAAFNFANTDFIVLLDNDIYNFDSFDIIEKYNEFGGPYLAFDEIMQIKLNDSGYEKISSEKRYGHGAFAVMKKSDFQRVNGFSNLCFGWGAEDTILNEKIKFKRMTHILGHINHPRRINLTPNATKNNKRVFKLYQAKKIKPQYDGLKQTIYNVVYNKKDNDIIYLGVKNVSVPKNYMYMAEYKRALKAAGIN